jgi:hypothetical protein
VGASVAGASVAGISVAGISVAGASVAAGACVAVAPPPQAARIIEAMTNAPITKYNFFMCFFSSLKLKTLNLLGSVGRWNFVVAPPLFYFM